MAVSLYADCAITNTCNFRCKHCDCGRHDNETSGLTQNWRARRILTPKKWLRIFSKFDVKRVWLRGVEPLLYPKFAELVQAICKGGEHRVIGVTTNGWFIKRYFETLVKYPESVFVSIDGWEKAHEAVRNVKGAFQRAYEGVVKLKEAGQKAWVSYAITPANTGDMVSLYHDLTSRGIQIIFNHYNYIHPDAGKPFNCLPTNMGEFKPRDVDLGEVMTAIKQCPDAYWSPHLTTRKELREYYRHVPTEYKKSDHICLPLEKQCEGEKVILAADGSFILSHRCWLTRNLGNALTSDTLPKDMKAFQKVVEKLRRQGLPPPCQRLCCSGKMV